MRYITLILLKRGNLHLSVLSNKLQNYKMNDKLSHFIFVTVEKDVNVSRCTGTGSSPTATSSSASHTGSLKVKGCRQTPYIEQINCFGLQNSCREMPKLSRTLLDNGYIYPWTLIRVKIIQIWSSRKKTPDLIPKKDGPGHCLITLALIKTFNCKLASSLLSLR